MPTVLRRGGLRFFFYSNERGEAPHVHVQRDRRIAKIWLIPVGIASTGGLPDVELHRIERIVEEEQRVLLKAWHEFFHR